MKFLAWDECILCRRVISTYKSHLFAHNVSVSCFKNSVSVCTVLENATRKGKNLWNSSKLVGGCHFVVRMNDTPAG